MGLNQPCLQALLYLSRQKCSPDRSEIALEKVRLNPRERPLQLPVFAGEGGSGHSARIGINAQRYSGAIQSVNRMALESVVHTRLHITAGADFQMDFTFLQ